MAIFLGLLDIWQRYLLGQRLLSDSNNTAPSDVLVRALKFTKPKISKWKDVIVETEMFGDLRKMNVLREN